MLFGIKDASNLTVIPSGTTKPLLYANYCNTSDINFKADSVYAMLKGVKSIRWDRNKEGSFKTEMEVFDMKWISLLLGTTFVTGVTPYAKREVLPVIGGIATLSNTPKVGSLVVYKLDPVDQVTHMNEQVAGVPTSTADKYSIASSRDMVRGGVRRISISPPEARIFVKCFFLHTFTARSVSREYSPTTMPS